MLNKFEKATSVNNGQKNVHAQISKLVHIIREVCCVFHGFKPELCEAENRALEIDQLSDLCLYTPHRH